MIQRRRLSRTSAAVFSAAFVLLAGLNASAAPVADAPEFTAVRGDRTSGWLPQTRSEVLARNGVVATSQPLAAQAGLQILKRGGNAFDAAVATAAVMNLQAIWFRPSQPNAKSPATAAAEQPIAGVYRAASDHRKDGQAVGW